MTLAYLYSQNLKGWAFHVELIIRGPQNEETVFVAVNVPSVYRSCGKINISLWKLFNVECKNREGTSAHCVEPTPHRTYGESP